MPTLADPGALAAQLDAAEAEHAPIAPPTASFALDEAAAYEVQRHLFARRRENGVRLVGRKIGAVEHARTAGFLTESMLLPSRTTLLRSALIAPRIEAEVGFVLGADLRGPGVTAAGVRAATAAIVPCFEIVDSRIADWRVTLPDAVADNACAAFAVVGDRTAALAGRDLATLDVQLLRDGEPVARGTGFTALGDPADAIAWLANGLGAAGDMLRAGQIVLPGATCGAHALEGQGRWRAVFEGIGEVEVVIA